MNKHYNKKRSRVKNLAFMGIFTALAYVTALVIRFPVPPFLTLDMKDAVIAIGAMACGPLSAIVMTAAVALLEFISVGDTGVYGLIMDVISSLGFAFTAALIYRYKKTFSGAIVSLVASVFAMTSIMLLANLLITPYYMGVSVAAVRGLIPKLLLPFNFLKGMLNAGVVALLYKPLTGALNRILGNKKEKTADSKRGQRTIWMSLAALLVIIAALLVLFLVMDAGVDFGK